MKLKKIVALIMFGALMAFAALVYSETNVSAQGERPLAEMALQKSEVPRNSSVLSAGPTTFNDLTQPINAFNSASFHVHEFTEAYQIATVGTEFNVADYLYRYPNASQAEEQAAAFVKYAMSDKKSQPLRPISVPEIPGTGSKNIKGQSVQVTDPETGGVYYWFIGVEGRTLVLLVVSGAPNEPTRVAFESFKAYVQQR